MTPTATAEIERLVAAATRGPWHQEGHSLYGDPDNDGYTLVATSPCKNSPHNGARFKTWEADATFIAEARIAVPKLLAALRAALERAERGELHVLELVRGISQSDAALRAAEAERDAAVAAEREACAQIVERMIDVVLSSHMRITLGMCVQDIRARAALHTSAKEGES